MIIILEVSLFLGTLSRQLENINTYACTQHYHQPLLSAPVKVSQVQTQKDRLSVKNRLWRICILLAGDYLNISKM